MFRGCVMLRHGEGESVPVALPLTQPRNIKLKIYVACSQCLSKRKIESISAHRSSTFTLSSSNFPLKFIPIDVATVLQLSKRAGVGTPGVIYKIGKHVVLEGVHSFHLIPRSTKSVQPFPQKLITKPFRVSINYI